MARRIRLILSAEDSAKAREILAANAAAQPSGVAAVPPARRPWRIAAAVLLVVVVGGVALAHFRPEWFERAPAVLQATLAWILELIVRLRAVLFAPSE